MLPLFAGLRGHRPPVALRHAWRMPCAFRRVWSHDRHRL